MRITSLGTNSGVSTRERNVSAVAFGLPEKGGPRLFDCGDRTQLRILHEGARVARLHRISVTHMHGNHVIGLPGLLCTFDLACDPEGVDVYGPGGLRENIGESMSRTGWSPEHPFVEYAVPPGVVHEAAYTREDAKRLPPHLHSTAAGAAGVARDVGARRLSLTHFSPRYATPQPLLDEAWAIFPETEAAEVLLRVEIPVRA